VISRLIELLCFLGEVVPTFMLRGDWRLLTADEQSEGWSLYEAGHFGTCVNVPENGWSSDEEILR
jgi:hypothetical protein